MVESILPEIIYPLAENVPVSGTEIFPDQTFPTWLEVFGILISVAGGGGVRACSGEGILIMALYFKEKVRDDVILGLSYSHCVRVKLVVMARQSCQVECTLVFLAPQFLHQKRLLSLATGVLEQVAKIVIIEVIY